MLVQLHHGMAHNCANRAPRRRISAQTTVPARGTDSALLHWAPRRRVHAFRKIKQWAVIQVASSCRMVAMKIITAIVRPFKLDELRHAIAQLGVQGVTVTEVYEADYGPRAKLEIAVDDVIAEPVLEAIANISRTGRNGDGKILVGHLEQAIRIRTGETGTAAT
jgi:nitrogen regulatory protein P-II 2